MCGISGFYSPLQEIALKAYYKSHLKMKHRGPDDEGFTIFSGEKIQQLRGDDTISFYNNLEHIKNFKKAKLVFGHRRLAIIDLTYHGHQPFHFENLILTYNGELYNYLELRNELQNFGYIFQTSSDTEVIIKAFHKFGINCFEKFVGMWALAIYNKIDKSVILSRDPFGIKPLYYHYENGILKFSSEIKVLTNWDYSLIETNYDAVFDFVHYNARDHSEQTFYTRICQLLPGNYLKFDNKGNYKISTYKSSKNIIQYNSPNEVFIDITNSINLHLRSDVPVGVSLSGGIDSNVITSYLASKTKNIKSFSSIFPDYPKFDESQYIKSTLHKYNKSIQPFWINTTSKESFESIDKILFYMDEPYLYLGMLQPYKVYQKARENGIKVMLGGQGGDELFGGYSEQIKFYYKELFKSFHTTKWMRWIKSKYFNLDFVKEVIHEEVKQYDPLAIKKQYMNNFYFDYPPITPFEINKQEKKYNSRTFFFNNGLREYLTGDDRMSMAHSIECRVPFLNINIYNKIIKSNYTHLMKNNIPKYYLKEAFKNFLAPEIYHRKDKMGYVSPQEIWLNKNKNVVEEVIKECRLYKEIKLNTDKLININHIKFWRLFIIAKWYNNLN